MNSRQALGTSSIQTPAQTSMKPEFVTASLNFSVSLSVHSSRSRFR